MPSLIKKYLMALTGFVMAGFVLVHMLGNLQMFLGPDAMNNYAYFLKSLPMSVLWGLRSFLILSALVHVWMAILITRENRRARPANYKVQNVVQASTASKTMGITGSVLLFFIVFHILHFTVHLVHPEYKTDAFYTFNTDGLYLFDVYSMVIHGFSYTWVSVFYIVSMALLCMHLSHGVSSMFQSLGFRNQTWRPRFDRVALVYGWVVFLGFVSIPASVLISKYTEHTIFPLQSASSSQHSETELS